ncbi:PEGA domain-containing protein [Mucilaginibacter kameinonensis]|uniref:PEGA domain-containing protein n=1 Tax=Mucilaginibacter kameinonensis TaxID=452286 RepID=UPI000EF790E0|nr:PEGA domain-containing protein [Mucilaginibacter kameinonensis]
MMKNIKKLLFVLLLLPVACKKPTEDLKIVVDTNVIKYTALIHVTDASNPEVVLKSGTLSVSGDNADDIYEISGNKQLNISNGVIAIGPGPAAVPVAGKPETYSVQVKVPGYNTATKSITFTADQKQQVINVALSKTGSVNSNPVTQKPLPVYDAVGLNFTGTCSSRPDLVIRPSMYVFFRETGSGAAYQYLGYMESGNMTVTALEKGKTYDFQVTYDGQNYGTTQQINNESESLTINMGSAICNNF